MNCFWHIHFNLTMKCGNGGQGLFWVFFYRKIRIVSWPMLLSVPSISLPGTTTQICDPHSPTAASRLLKSLNFGKLICFYQDHFLQYPTGKEPFTFLDLRGPFRHKSKRDPIDIAHICHNRHDRRWCTFFKPVLLLAS